jgi:hypothetical protein
MKVTFSLFCRNIVFMQMLLLLTPRDHVTKVRPRFRKGARLTPDCASDVVKETFIIKHLEVQ